MLPQGDNSPENEKIERLRRAMYSRTMSEKLKERERRALEAPNEGVEEDWVRPEPKLAASMTAPRGMNITRSIIWWFLGAAAIFFIGSTLYFIYFFTIGGGSSSASVSNIDIVVSGPPQVPGGGSTQLQISITNRNRVALELAELVVTYPDGTRSQVDYSTPLPSLRQGLGTIPPGATRQGTVKAVFSGTSGAHGDVKVDLEYHLQGSNAIFTASSDYAFVFSSSPLSISIDGNTQVVSGQPMQLTISVASNASAPIKDALLSVTYPFGFKLTNTAPASSSGNFWQLGDFKPGDRKVVTVSGTLTGESGDKRVFNFTAGTRVNATSSVITTPVSINPFSVNIAEPFLSLDLAINNSTSSSITVKPGDDVEVAINYQNNLSSAISDAVVVARISGLELDGSTVNAENGFYRSSDNTLLWDKSTTHGALANLASGANGSLRFNFKVPDTLANTSNPYINISINAAGNRVAESGVPQNLQSTTNRHIGITSSLKLAANGLYYTSPYGSTGPMPPKANAETTYAMVLTITNTSNTITGAKVTAVLPPYVRWTRKSSPISEHVTFNPNNSTVTWDLGDIAPGVGTAGLQPRQIGFEIGFTPSTSQIQQEPVLLQDIVLTGIDAATGFHSTSTAPDVTTNIAGDAGFNSSSATVVK